MEVGRFYLNKKNYVAAINRFKVVVSDYQTTAHVEEALMRLTECYMALGVRNEAQTAVAVLGHNFPRSRWYKDAYALLKSDGLSPAQDGESWISKAWKSVPKLSLGGPTLTLTLCALPSHIAWLVARDAARALCVSPTWPCRGLWS